MNYELIWTIMQQKSHPFHQTKQRTQILIPFCSPVLLIVCNNMLCNWTWQEYKYNTWTCSHIMFTFNLKSFSIRKYMGEGKVKRIALKVSLFKHLIIIFTVIVLHIDSTPLKEVSIKTRLELQELQVMSCFLIWCILV